MIDNQAVTSLIKAALDDSDTQINASLTLDECLTFGKKQGIELILIIGMCKLHMPYTPSMRKIALRAAMISNRQANVAEKLYSIFQTNQIDFMPLKGDIMKSLYPINEMRSMADIDVLIRKEQYKKLIRPVLQFEGFHECYESDHEYVWDKNGIHVELHKRLIPSYNKDYYAYYGDGWQLAKPTDVPYRYEMSHEDTFSYIFTHYAKHYRDAGAGIRQALDLYVYRKAYPDMDAQHIQQTLNQLQLECFYANTMHMLDVWFGSAQHTEASQLISDRLFASGMFGNSEDKLISARLKQANHCGSIKKARISEWFRRVFLPYESMCRMYPILLYHPSLLPILWFPRWFRIITHKRYRFHEYLREDSQINAVDIEQYRSMLHKSGLDFNFK